MCGLLTATMMMLMMDDESQSHEMKDETEVKDKIETKDETKMKDETTTKSRIGLVGRMPPSMMTSVMFL
jgi:hypothetical protein